MSDFEWQTTENGGWDDPVSSSRHGGTPEEPPPRPWTQRRWLLLVITVILAISAAGYGSYTTLNKQIEAREAEIRADIETSFRVWQQAAINGDVEVLNTVLSGSDLRWSGQQQLLTEQGLLWTRPFNGWHKQSTAPLAPSDIEIALSPSLNEATLTLTHTYTIASDQTVTLQQTTVFRQGGNRWLYAPPPPDFWGEDQQVSGDYLTTFYPARDAADAVALHEFVERYVALYCAQTNGHCRDSLNLTLRLDTDPSTLPTIFNIYQATFWTTTRYQSIDLPTPSLVGRPLDEASRDALFGHYAAYVLAGINRRVVIDGRVGQAPFDQVLFNQQLAKLGLPQRGINEKNDNTAVSLYATLGEYESLWSVSSLPLEETYSAHAAQLIRFLQERIPQTSPLVMQRQLGAGSFDRWLEEVTGQTRSELERAWLRYVLAQDKVQAETPTDLLPDQLIKLLCTVGDRTMLVDYSPHKDRWLRRQTVGPTSRFTHVFYALPDDQGYTLETRPHSDGDLWSMAVVRPGVDQIIFQASNQPQSLSYTGVAHPHGRDLLMQSSHPDYGFTESHLLNLDTCNKDDCPLTTLDGWPIWSASGEQLILLAFDGLHLGDPSTGQKTQRIGRGYAPFWLDDDTYGFLRATRVTSQHGVLSSELDLVLGQLDSGRKVVRTAGELTANLVTSPESQPEVGRAKLVLATTNPHDAQTVYLVTQGMGENLYYLWGYDSESENTAVLYTLPTLPIRLQFSPNGRWLSLLTQSPTNTSPQPTRVEFSTILHSMLTQSPTTASPSVNSDFMTLHLVDLRRDRTYNWTISLPPETSPSNWQPDWSTDSRWLLLNGREYIHLVQPSTGYEWRAIHDYDSCQSAQWLTP